ncbi:hypothetical protein HYH03_005045 [Edaphochlamys debaryana]|uniref:Nitroreductase domain-containing protein n=1 Tax=Edaphochlamys debaryana TaxID=47281 RepID=A0A835YG80_9CHLO|nr:hypothetical protein HYH03_005045 [Edaphochlamys debaryana]|eukprot:KAG2497044.1 hypothetical protein HYH03_005045 [Edaphochlamys debaryana]
MESDTLLRSKARQVQQSDIKTTSIGAELGLLGLLLASGLAGLAAQSATVTVTMFCGGVLTWLFVTLPDFFNARAQGLKQQQQEGKEGKAGAEEGKQGADNGAAAGKPPASAGPLPSPEAALALIARRRSVFPKDYNGGRVTREEIEKLVQAANWAPTHGQTEPWRFVVLEGASKKAMEDLTMQICRTRLPADKAEKTLEKLTKKADSTWGKISAYLAIVAKRQARADKAMPEWEEMAATACAVQNMALMCTAMGLAGYWTSWQEVAREAPEMKEFLGMAPEDRFLGMAPEDRVMGFFTLGRADPERLAGYRGVRGPWADKVAWRG